MIDRGEKLQHRDCMSGFYAFNSVSPQHTKCYLCTFFLDDGRNLLGHDSHGFHEDCIMTILRSNPTTHLACPIRRCDFVATHIHGESLAMILKAMGIRPVSVGILSQPVVSTRIKTLFDSDGFMALEGTPSSGEAGRALTIVAHDGDDGRKIGQLLNYFRSKNVDVPEVDRGEAGLTVMNNNQFHAFQLLIQGDQPVDSNHFIAISMRAIKINKPEYIRVLWRDKQTDPALKAELIKQALKVESFEIAREMIISGKSTIPDEYVNEFFLIAARFGQQGILELLRKQPITLAFYEEGIRLSKHNHFPKIATWLDETR